MPTNKVVNRALEINRLHESLCDGLRTTLQTAIKIGGLLAEQKQELGYGQWGAWIEEHLKFSRQTASKYMRCHERREELGKLTFQVLPIEDVARLSAKPTETEIQEAQARYKELKAEAQKVAEAKLKLEEQEREIEAEQAEAEPVEVEDVEFEDVESEESEADFEKRVEEELATLRQQRSGRKLVDAYWGALTKRRSPADQRQMARAVCQYLFKKYPELDDHE